MPELKSLQGGQEVKERVLFLPAEEVGLGCSKYLDTLKSVQISLL